MMITLENHATSALGRPGRRDIGVCIEGVRRADGAVRPGIVVNELNGNAVTIERRLAHGRSGDMAAANVGGRDR